MNLNLSENALRVLERRYLNKDIQGQIIETPQELFRRVARAIAGAEQSYGCSQAQVKQLEEDFFNMMTGLEFMPNSPCLMNADKELGQLSACFDPEQIIITKDGLKKISEVKVGDYVLTHQNRYRKVTEIFTRNADEIYHVSAYKLPVKTLKVTAEHPVLAIKKQDKNRLSPSWIRAKDLCVGDYLALSFPKETVDIDSILISDFIKNLDIIEEAGYLYEKNEDIRIYVRKDGSIYTQNRNRSGDISRQVKPVKNKIKVDRDLMRLFGYYLAEGCISENKCLRFVFSVNERNYTEDVLTIIKDKFGISSHIEETNSADRKWLSIRFHSKILAEFFLSLFGTGFNIKKIPHWMILLPIEKQKALLNGMFRGDSYTFKSRNIFFTELVMCNEQLVYSAWQILARLGIFTSLYFHTMPKLGKVQPVVCKVSGKEGTKLINEFLEKDFSHNGIEFKREIAYGGRVFTPITEIIKQDYSGLVYNLEVEEDHSYCANMVAVHNCFTLPIKDSMESIFETLKATAMIHKSGGGTGFSFSNLRPKNSVVRSTGGVASGPVSFMKVYDAATEAVKQGGTRRGANMGILKIDHPDILEFITCKDKTKVVTNFNISVAVTEDFMKKLQNNEDYDLIDPRTKKVVSRLNTRETFDLIVRQAYKNGEPGIIFIDKIERDNPTPKLGRIESTNPCGEQPILPYESCDLGSINLVRMIKQTDSGIEIDWEKLKRTVHLAVHFLDNVIDANKFPLPEIERATKLTRKIGLGIMGWASLLIRLSIPYNSDEALGLADKLMSFILTQAKEKSSELAREKGTFPAFKDSIWEKQNIPIRNATLTTIAPTGTISIIAGPTSSGIEPLFAVSYHRNVMDNDKLVEAEPTFERIAKERGFYNRELMAKIAESGSIQNIEEIPADVRRIFVTAHDISPEWHIRMQAVFQQFTNNAVSKTINFSEAATVEDVQKSYLLAYELGCKGITVYRDKSRQEQVLNIAGNKQAESDQEVKTQIIKIVPQPRPEVTTGTTTKVATGCGNLYITINSDDQGLPFEVFTQMGKAGGCAASQLEAIGRLVSLALRSEIEVKSIIEQLRNIRCPSPSWEKGLRIFSCADALSRVLEKRLVNDQEAVKVSSPKSPQRGVSDNEQAVSVASPKSPQRGVSNIVGVCPDCGGALRHEEGCVKCYACGFSKC